MARIIILAVILLLPVTSPAQVWVERYNGPANDSDEPEAIAVDNLGNVYVTGASWGSGTGYDYATVKYDSAGVEQWAARYDGPAHGTDEAKAIALAGTRVCVTGGSATPDFFTDMATVMYGPSGDTLWTARYDGPAGRNDHAFAVATTPDHGVCVTGYRTGSGTGWGSATYTGSNYIGCSSNTNTEIQLKFSEIGNPTGTVRILVFAQNENDQGVWASFPTDNPASGSGSQTFTHYYECDVHMDDASLDSSIIVKGAKGSAMFVRSPEFSTVLLVFLALAGGAMSLRWAVLRRRC